MDEDGVMHLGRRVKGLAEGSELALWPSIDIAALTEEQRQDFLRRKKAVLLYLSGESFEEIRVDLLAELTLSI